MGYTHYWQRNDRQDAESWKKLADFTRDAIKATSATGVKIAGGLGTGKPEVDGEVICLNGLAPELDHETLLLERVGETGFAFCKTARKPYDALVVAVLIEAQELGFLTWSSDGDDDEHQEGKDLRAQVKASK